MTSEDSYGFYLLYDLMKFKIFASACILPFLIVILSSDSEYMCIESFMSDRGHLVVIGINVTSIGILSPN